MPSIEFVLKWFAKAARDAKRQGKADSALLWRDGFTQLADMNNELAALKGLLGKCREGLGFYALMDNYDEGQMYAPNGTSIGGPARINEDCGERAQALLPQIDAALKEKP